MGYRRFNKKYKNVLEHHSGKVFLIQDFRKEKSNKMEVFRQIEKNSCLSGSWNNLQFNTIFI
ncbi:hypothetical protein C6W23_09585 [Bacillus atrophaeus]|nr:hypothetical protein C6W23_09585 [Bacillus atrophaeus]